VQGWLSTRGVGFQVGSARIPVVPQAVLFDLLNGGDKNWGETPPHAALARAACEAADAFFALGSAGAGFGATTADLRGGLGSASAQGADGCIVGALVAVNAVGSVTVGDGPRFWAAPFEEDGEFGDLGIAPLRPPDARLPRLKTAATAQSTTLAIVGTNARLSRTEAHRLAIMAHTGLARAIHPVHTPLDGDAVFALATGEVALGSLDALARLGALAADVLARAVARGVYEADEAPSGWTGPPAWRSRFSARGRS
jgi:D-aminopeptidase